MAEAAPPAPKKGVNPGESLGVIFTLKDNGTLEDVVDELATGELRIGIHVINFDSGGSESFVNVPEPATLLLLTLGAGLVRRRRRR